RGGAHRAGAGASRTRRRLRPGIGGQAFRFAGRSTHSEGKVPRPKRPAAEAGPQGGNPMDGRIRRAVVALGGSALLSLPFVASAQPEVPHPSPRAKVEQRVGITDFSVDYSSPGVKGRRIWGELVPCGELWRAGANSGTVLTASRDFFVGET